MTVAADVRTMPKTWLIPCEWPGERCFILCSGESIGPQAEIIKRLRGRFIAVKHAVKLRPDADVLFLSGDHNAEASGRLLIPQFRGKYVIVRSKWDPSLPETVKRVARAKDHGALCELRDHVSGYDCGTSAINLAYHFGATEIVLLGYDMTGGHFCTHPLRFPPTDQFRRHMGPLDALNDDAKAKGIRIVNCSPTSAVTAFERRPVQEFL